MAQTKEEIKKYKAEWFQKNKERVREKNRLNLEKYRNTNRDKVNSKRLDYYNDNKEKEKLKRILYCKNNPEKIKDTRHKSSIKSTNDLKGYYVIQLLSRQGFPRESITPELIEVKRIILKTKRL